MNIPVTYTHVHTHNHTCAHKGEYSGHTDNGFNEEEHGFLVSLSLEKSPYDIKITEWKMGIVRMTQPKLLIWAVGLAGCINVNNRGVFIEARLPRQVSSKFERYSDHL